MTKHEMRKGSYCSVCYLICSTFQGRVAQIE